MARDHTFFNRANIINAPRRYVHFLANYVYVFTSIIHNFYEMIRKTCTHENKYNSRLSL